MIKLGNVTTRKVTSGDLKIACNPPLVFEIKTVFPRPVLREAAKWQTDGSSDAGIAATLASRLFVSVSQNGDRYPLGSQEAIEQLRLAIEDQVPGSGDDFICSLLEGFINDHYDFFTKELTGSETLLPPVDDGEKQEK